MGSDYTKGRHCIPWYLFETIELSEPLEFGCYDDADVVYEALENIRVNPATGNVIADRMKYKVTSRMVGGKPVSELVSESLGTEAVLDTDCVEIRDAH